MKSTLLVSSLLLFGITAHAAPFGFRPFIVGGTEVAADDPIAHSVVAIFIQLSYGEGMCTGSIIAPNLIVTAAHCASDDTGAPLPLSSLTVAYGLNVRNDTGTGVGWPGTRAPIQSSAVNTIWVYQGYPSQMNNPVDEGDVALIRIEGTVPSGYVPVQMLDNADELKAGGTVTLAGYGITDASSQTGGGILREVSGIRIVNPDLGKTEVVLDQSQGHGACHGDSGGPGYITDSSGHLVLWGLTDRGYPDGSPDDCMHESVYTKVTAYQGWIADSVKALSAVSSAPSR